MEYEMLTLLIGFLYIILYFFPAIIARKKKHACGIFFLNLFLGWTFLGWVGAFVWACCDEEEKKEY